MPFDLLTCAPSAALDTLGAALAQVQGDDRLADVTVVVPTNVAGVMARRALGRRSGVLGVNMVTLNRLAELIAGPALAHAGRQPISTPILDLTIRTVLDEAPGSFAAVAHHPATVVALREAHQELRLAGPNAAELLCASGRGREVVRVSRALTRMLQRRWYDEADLLAGAAQAVADNTTSGLDRVVMYLPAPFEPLALELVRAIGSIGSVPIVVTITGDPDADREAGRLLHQLDPSSPTESVSGARPAAPTRLVSTTDADDEVRIAVRAVVDAARGATTGSPIPLERIALLWPTHRPYARLVEHHLTADRIAWNGHGGTELVERIAPRLILDLLDVDRRGLDRRALFELLADVPKLHAAGRSLRTAEWERVSRAAGVSRDEDWVPRLRSLAANPRWTDAAESLVEFVGELRASLGRPSDSRPWREWADWCVEQLDAWLGKGAIARLSDAEYSAWEALMSSVDRLRCLDDVTGPATRREFRTVLEGELDDAALRTGRIGTGVTVGSLAAASGLDVDVAIVLGAAEGMMPPAPRADPLLSQTDRERAGLVSPDQRAHRLHQEFVGLLGRCVTLVTMPRGDLRATAAHQLSRWLAHVDAGEIDHVSSAMAGIADLDFAPCERERRLSDRLRAITTPALEPAHDPAYARGRAMLAARASCDLTEYDGDLPGSTVPVLAAEPGSAQPQREVSPTQIQTWANCPHAYFMRYLLGVKPVEEPGSQISINPLDRGSVQHDALDAFHRDVIEGRLPQPGETGWTDTHLDALLAHFDTATANAERQGRTGRPATWAGERARMRSDLADWLQHDNDIVRVGKVTVLASEHRFPAPSTELFPVDVPDPVSLRLPDGRQLRVLGSIDRLDLHDDGTLVVTDHKTGGASSFRKVSVDDPTVGGTVFQLPAYAAAARALIATLGVGEATSLRAEYSMLRKGGYKRFGFQFDDDVWNAVTEQLGRVVDGIEQGWFPQTPPRPGFSLYTECLYCDPDELGTGPAWSRWNSKRADPRIERWFGAAPSTDEDDA